MATNDQSNGETDGSPREIAHQLATRAANVIVADATAAGLAWTDIMLACETTVAIVVASAVRMQERRFQDPARYARTLTALLAERAGDRVVELIKGNPDGG